MLACSSVKETLNVYVTIVELICVSHRYSESFTIRYTLYLKLLGRKIHLSRTENTFETQNTFLFLTPASEILSHGAKINPEISVFHVTGTFDSSSYKKNQKTPITHFFIAPCSNRSTMIPFKHKIVSLLATVENQFKFSSTKILCKRHFVTLSNVSRAKMNVINVNSG